MDSVLDLWKNMAKWPLFTLFRANSLIFKKDELSMEIARIALPTALALTADPIASLIDTAFVGHLGPVELGAVGISIAVFNQVSKIFVFPLLSVTTSFVAEENTAKSLSSEANSVENFEEGSGFSEERDLEELILRSESTSEPSLNSACTEFSKVEHDRRYVPSASMALVVGSIVGLIQALFLMFSSKSILKYMGVNNGSQMLKPALKYLTLRSLGSPAIVLSMAMQGIFRGLKDTKTPLYATVVGNGVNIVLDPVLMFVLDMGVSGAAIAHVISQYLTSIILLWRLMERVDLVPLSIKDLQLRRFLKDGFLLVVRVTAVTSCVTMAASLAAKQGSTSMAAFQVCLQLWLASSLLADGLAVAGQAILASAFAEKDYNKATVTAARVLQLGLVLGIVLSVILLVVLQFASGIFTKDVEVLQLISVGIPFVAVTQPINSVAFVSDGINYGASDFAYTAYSMAIVATVSISILNILSKTHNFVGVWISLSIYMSLRLVAGLWRIGTGRGPWRFLWN